MVGDGLEVVRTPASLPELTRAAAAGRRASSRARAGGRLRLPGVPARLRRDRPRSASCSSCWRRSTRAALGSSSAELPRPTLIHRQVQCPWALKGTVMRVLNERFADANVDLTDGIKIFDERGWVQVLPDPRRAADPPLRGRRHSGGVGGARDGAPQPRHRRDRTGGDRRGAVNLFTNPEVEVDGFGYPLLESRMSSTDDERRQRGTAPRSRLALGRRAEDADRRPRAAGARGELPAAPAARQDRHPPRGARGAAAALRRAQRARPGGRRPPDGDPDRQGRARRRR